MEYLDRYEVVPQRRMSDIAFCIGIHSLYYPQSGTDDAIQRVYILLTSILLIGYTAQCASIEFRQDENGQIFIPSQGYEALRGATAFLLVAKGCRLLQLLWYAWYLPKFRSSHLVQALFTLIPSVISLCLLKVGTLIATTAISILGIGLDIIGKYIAGILVSLFGADGPNKHHVFIPALEIGHVIERTTAFYVLVAGEVLISASYIATESEIGIRDEWVRCCLGVILAFWLCWVWLKVILSEWVLIIRSSSISTPTLAGSFAMHYAVTGSRLSPGRRFEFKLCNATHFSRSRSSTSHYARVSSSWPPHFTK
jgi:hypothetical protein